MWPADKLGATIKCDRFSRQLGQVAHSFDDLARLGDTSIACRAGHDWFRAFVRVLQKQSEAANARDQRRDVCLPKALFQQDKISLPCVDARFDARDISTV